MKHKMNFLILILSLLIIESCTLNSEKTLKEISNSSFEIKQISKGNNNPVIDISKDSLDLLLVALHYKIPIKEIEDYFNWNNSTTNKKIKQLTENGLLKKTNNTYIPAMCIFTLKEGNVLIQ